MNLQALFKPLESRDPETLKTAVSVLKSYADDSSVSDGQRRAILERMAAFVQDRSPLPQTAKTIDYCLKPAEAVRYPTEVTLAIEAIGHRTQQDTGLQVNLTGVNLAYASLQGLDLRNVRFDNSLMCRTFLNDSRFDGATFENAVLRFSFMESASGLSYSQLLATYSLYKTKVPAGLYPRLQSKIATDPDI